jgi:hypothetical protein
MDRAVLECQTRSGRQSGAKELEERKSHYNMTARGCRWKEKITTDEHGLTQIKFSAAAYDSRPGLTGLSGSLLAAA